MIANYFKYFLIKNFPNCETLFTILDEKEDFFFLYISEKYIENLTNFKLFT